MMTKTLLRDLYNRVRSRRLRVLCIRAVELLGIPIYRVALDTNNLCNLRCIMCYMSLPEYRPSKTIMSLEMFESIAQQVFGKARLLDLSCGFEPFVTKGFIDYMRIARRYCRGQISLCTNGLLLDQAKMEAIVAEHLLDEINISCDGLSHATYDSIRKNGDFDRLLSVLRSLREAKERHHTNRPVVRLNYTMMKRNIEELHAVHEFTREYGVQILQLRHVKLTAAFSSLFPESLYFHQELSDRIISEVKGRFDGDPERRLIHPPLFSGKVTAAADKSICAYPWFNFVIASNADLHLCNIGRVGNFHEQSFARMIRSQYVQDVRKDLLRGRFEKHCRSCHTISDMDNVRMKETFICEASEPSTVPSVVSRGRRKPLFRVWMRITPQRLDRRIKHVREQYIVDHRWDRDVWKRRVAAVPGYGNPRDSHLQP